MKDIKGEKKPFSEEWIKWKQKKTIQRIALGLCLLLIVSGLFLVNGETMVHKGLAQMKIMNKAEAAKLLDTLEASYYGQYVFDYQEYGRMRQDFLKSSYMTYYAFYDFFNEIAVMANDYYSSLIFNTPEVPYYDNYIKKLEQDRVGFSIETLYDRPVGILTLYSLNGTVLEQVSEVLSQCRNEGVDHIIIDLTQSPLGTYQDGMAFLDFFISDRELMRFQTKDGYMQIHMAQTGAFAFEKIYVLIDQEVSGVGEIIALSLQKQLGDKVHLVGQTPYGVPLVFAYDIHQDYGYIFKYAIGEWRVGEEPLSAESYQLSHEVTPFNQTEAFQWITDDLQ